MMMKWTVIFDKAFESEYAQFSEEVQTAIATKSGLLEVFGPQLGRPHVNTLKGSKFMNMKELRFDAADGVWRVAFAFDVQRQAIILVAGDKSGEGQKRFYNWLISTADERFKIHLKQQKSGE